jgi:uncharacterized protein YggE
MKNLRNKLALLLVIAITSLSCSSHAQQITNPVQRTIEVTGSAEMQLEPNLVKIKIVLNTDSKDKKNEFYKLLKKNGVKEKNITLEGMNRYNWWWYYNHTYQQTEQTYMVTIDSAVNAIELMQDLKKSWVRRIDISEKKNTELQKYRKEVKIGAVKAAKEKASYLLEALDEEVGAVISIIEINNDHKTTRPNYYWNNSISNTSTSNSVMSRGSSTQVTIGGISMDKIRYEVKITFTIKQK